jgi:hypothetical protein
MALSKPRNSSAIRQQLSDFSSLNMLNPVAVMLGASSALDVPRDRERPSGAPGQELPQRSQIVLVQRECVPHQCLLDGEVLSGIEISDLPRRFSEVFATPTRDRSHAHVEPRFV